MKKEKSKKPLYVGEIKYDIDNLRELTISARHTQRNAYFIVLLLLIVEQFFFVFKSHELNFMIPLFSMFMSGYIMYFDLSKISYKRQVLNNDNKELTHVVELYQDKVLLKNKDNNNFYPFKYTDIKRVYETKNLLVLILNLNMGIAMRKESLGNKIDEVKEFLLETCPLKKKKIKMIVPISTKLFIVSLIIDAIFLGISIAL